MDTLLQRPNPLVTNLQNLQESNSNLVMDDGDKLQIEGDIHNIVPAFSSSTSSNPIEPFHGEAAVAYLMEQYEQELNQLQEQFASSSQDNITQLSSELHRILQPVFSLTTMLRLLAQVSEMSQTMQWQRVYDKLQEKVQAVDQQHAMWILQALADTNDTTTTAEEQESADRLRQTLEVKYGAHTMSDDDKDKYTTLSNALEKVIAAVKQQQRDDTLDEGGISSFQEPTRETIGLMYSLIGILSDRSKLLGYEHFYDQTMAHNRRMARTNEIEQLHHVVLEQHVRPILEATYRRTHKSADEMALDEYLESPNAQQQPQQPPRQQSANGELSMHELILQDEMMQFRFEKHVTLQGAMAFLTRLLKDVFGVTLVRHEGPVKGWIKEVQLYHIFDSLEDDKKHLGSFYLDPFRRSGKTRDVCVVPLQNRGVKGEIPVAAMLLQAELPTWEDDPASLKWEDVKGLFHEMGHILQTVMLQSKYGVTLGPHAIPRDVCEVLPQFMEHWLLERSTIYGLMAASDSQEEFYEESVDAFYRVLAREKAEALAHQVYYATMEQTLLGGFDLRGKESIMALQGRLADEIVPHNVPLGNDVTPLMRVLQPNALGDPISQYIYLWGDAVAAQIFESLKQTYSKDESQMTKMTKPLRELLLYPGAIVPGKAIRSEWSLSDSVSPHALIKRYGIDKLPRD